MEGVHRRCVGQEGGQIEERGYAVIRHHRQRPGDEGEFLLGAEQDHEEEDGGEDPQGDGHKHHKAIRWQRCVGGAGYQCPMEQAQNYFSHHEDGRDASDKGHVQHIGDVGGQSSEAVASLLRALGVGGAGFRSNLGREVCHDHAAQLKVSQKQQHQQQTP